MNPFAKWNLKNSVNLKKILINLNTPKYLCYKFFMNFNDRYKKVKITSTLANKCFFYINLFIIYLVFYTHFIANGFVWSNFLIYVKLYSNWENFLKHCLNFIWYFDLFLFSHEGNQRPSWIQYSWNYLYFVTHCLQLEPHLHRGLIPREVLN